MCVCVCVCVCVCEMVCFLELGAREECRSDSLLEDLRKYSRCVSVCEPVSHHYT